MHRMNWKAKMMAKTLFTLIYTCDIFYEELSEFIIIFVFRPV